MTRLAEFGTALLNPDLAQPEGLVSPSGAPAGKRFDVYRNNVAVSLTEALETGFPVIRKLVGDDFFKAMAGVHLRQSPPKSPLLMLYGEDFPGFLASFPPVAHLPYLPDVAQLELALRRAYHAADATPFDASVLQTLPTERLMAARLTLAPAVQIVGADYPIHGIWRANTQAGAPAPEPRGESVIVTRPDFDPMVDPLDPAALRFCTALLNNETFGMALEQAGADGSELDLGATLGLLLSRGAISSLKEDHIS